MKFNKIYFFLKNLKKINFSITKKKIVVFDGLSLQELNYTLKIYDYFTLEDRLERINTFYITPSIIFYFFVYFFLIFKSYSLKVIYSIALIKSLKPKIVITSIDNSINFSLCAKILNKEIFFIAIQNAGRLGFRDINYCLKNNIIIPKDYKKKLNIPNYICFGQDEIDGSIKEKLNIEKFYNFGSIRVGNCLHYIKENNIKLNKKLFDVCIFSEALYNYDAVYKNSHIEESAANLLKFTIKFVIQNNLKFIFASRNLSNTNEFKLELDFYKHYLDKKEFEFLILNSNNKKNFYSSYLILLQSTLAIGFYTTLLLDKIGFKEKILSCNFTDLKFFDFPISGICSMNSFNYNEFSSRAKLIMSLQNEEYLKRLDRNPNYVMTFDKEENVIEKTRRLIKRNL